MHEASTVRQHITSTSQHHHRRCTRIALNNNISSALQKHKLYTLAISFGALCVPDITDDVGRCVCVVCFRRAEVTHQRKKKSLWARSRCRWFSQDMNIICLCIHVKCKVKSEVVCAMYVYKYVCAQIIYTHHPAELKRVMNWALFALSADDAEHEEASFSFGANYMCLVCCCWPDRAEEYNRKQRVPVQRMLVCARLRFTDDWHHCRHRAAACLFVSSHHSHHKSHSIRR